MTNWSVYERGWMDLGGAHTKQSRARGTSTWIHPPARCNGVDWVYFKIVPKISTSMLKIGDQSEYW